LEEKSMSGRTFTLLALLGLGATAALLAGAAPRPADAPQWEYAAYRSLGNRYHWQTPDAEIFVHSLADFFREVGLKARMTKQASETELINHFGRQGWELIQVIPPSGTHGTWVFWFKRPSS